MEVTPEEDVHGSGQETRAEREGVGPDQADVTPRLDAAAGLADEPNSRAAVDFFEKSVRPVLSESCQKCHGPRHGAGQPWDHHDDLETGHRELGRRCDQAIGAFLKDLKQRGMLDDSLVVWGGEFGRAPTVELPTPGSNQGKMNGRDHNHYDFTTWPAAA